MSTSAVGASMTTLDLFKQRRNDISAMESAIQAGDLTTAQQSLAALQQTTQSATAALSADGSLSSSGNPFTDAIKNDLTTIMNAVQAGDLNGAQTGLVQLQADQKAVLSNTTGSSQGAVGATSADTSSQDAFTADLSALFSAVSTGNPSAMQSTATTLQSDLQTLLGSQSATSAQIASSAASNAPTSASILLNDLQSLISAAQSGDTSGAQQAMQNLAKDAQGAAASSSGGHHHHHHAASASSTSQTPPASAILTSSSSFSAASKGPDAESQLKLSAEALRKKKAARSAKATGGEKSLCETPTWLRAPPSAWCRSARRYEPIYRDDHADSRV